MAKCALAILITTIQRENPLAILPLPNRKLEMTKTLHRGADSPEGGQRG
jgi:hypothetical protein